MSNTAKIFLFLFITVSATLGNRPAFGKNPSAMVFLGSRQLSPEVKFIERKKVIYINHSLLEEIFKTKTEWELKKGSIKINLGNFKIEFQVESSLLNINGAKYKLTDSLFEQGDDLWFPLEFFQLLGIKESSREEQSLKLKWEDSSLLSLDLIQFQGRPALEIILTGAAEFKHFLLTNPDRLVCQFPDTKVHFIAVPRLKGFRNEPVKKVRFSRDDTGLLTLAFDLTASTGYEVLPDPDFPERILIVFNYFLEDLSLFHHEAETKINIKTSAPANFQIIQNNDRNLVVHLDHAVLKTKKRNITGDGGLIEKISLDQIEADKVRISVTLLKDEELFVAPAPDDLNSLQIRTVPLITGIGWTSLKQGSLLVVDSDGVLKDSPVADKTFVIDPGHGGQDNGASGKKGTLEKELNLEVSLRLKDLLEEAGAKVVLTRFDDTFISLYERAFLANFLMVDFFISIHTNSHPKAETEGIEAFYYPNHSHSRPLATSILDAMVRETGLKKLAVKTNNFAVIRETQMPGVLLELGFLSNLQEEQILRSDEFKNNAAQGIFRGIIDFFE